MIKHATTTHEHYYVPESSYWPIVGSIGLLFTFVGLINWIHQHAWGKYSLLLGTVILTVMMFGWFGAVVRENLAGLYSKQMDRSFRWGMAWFIFSEVCFFAAFFGVLFYVRAYGLPVLGGELSNTTSQLSHLVLWPNFKAIWPVLANPNNVLFTASTEIVSTWGVPALNTLILLTSGVTITWAHWGLQIGNRQHLLMGLFATIMLGIIFLSLQGYEYWHAYHELGLTLGSGIYGSIFFLLTGFHGLHVTIGAIILTAIFFRAKRGDFTPENHFGFEAAAWYWHFVDIVWLCLFIVVYWI